METYRSVTSITLLKLIVELFVNYSSGNAINRQSQLSLTVSRTRLCPPHENGDVMLSNGGLYAPTIRYQNGTFYIVCTNIIHDRSSDDGKPENFIVSSRNIWSNEWSDAIYFDFNGIDPSIFFDDSGRAYIQGSAGPGPMTKLHLFEVDLKTGKKLSEEKKIWNGTGGIYPEGPHIYKKDGLYYLVISEGGTFDDHMITVARSKDIWGPYEQFEKNPILTARGTDEYIQNTGHSDMFQDPQGRWWGVCLGVRKDESRFIMGRETFLTTGEWPEGEWPSLNRVKSNPNSQVEQNLCAEMAHCLSRRSQWWIIFTSAMQLWVTINSRMVAKQSPSQPARLTYRNGKSQSPLWGNVNGSLKAMQ